jgi:hypothetical protein
MGAWKADGDRKRKYCDWSDTNVLAVPIALTLIVKMNCSAILALLLWWMISIHGGLWCMYESRGPGRLIDTEGDDKSCD